MRPLYEQFSNFMEFFANKLTKKYHFKFFFDGSNYPHERQGRFDRMMKVADKGIVLGFTDKYVFSMYEVIDGKEVEPLKTKIFNLKDLIKEK